MPPLAAYMKLPNALQSLDLPMPAITHTFSVPDISCQHCIDAITKEVGDVAGVETVSVDIRSTSVTVVGGSEKDLVNAIDEAGYDVA